MRNIFSPVKMAVVVSLAMGVYAPGSEAAPIFYNLSWQGNAGYTATGMFSYDDQFQGGIVTKNQLNDLMITFFDPLGNQLQSFSYPPFSSEFNFNFDTTTGTILQVGNFDQPNGFDLGIDAGAGTSGIDFYSCNNGSGGCDFSTTAGQGIILQQDTASNSCINLPNPNCVELDNGGVLVATRVPEPTSTLSLLALGTIGAASTLKRKLKPSQSTEKETTKVG